VSSVPAGALQLADVEAGEDEVENWQTGTPPGWASLHDRDPRVGGDEETGAGAIGSDPDFRSVVLAWPGKPAPETCPRMGFEAIAESPPRAAPALDARLGLLLSREAGCCCSRCRGP
jgi:hypothetical protein